MAIDPSKFSPSNSFTIYLRIYVAATLHLWPGALILVVCSVLYIKPCIMTTVRIYRLYNRGMDSLKQR